MNHHFHLVLGGFALVFLVACQTQQFSSESVSDKNSVTSPIEVSLEKIPFSFKVTTLKVLMEQGPSASKETSTLVQNANGCGPVRPAGYYEKLAEKFSTETETIYLLQDPALPFATFKVHILPNRMAYKTSKEFIDDFFRCGAGGYFPKLASKKWLLFTENCGDMNQSDAVNNRCLEFEKTLEPSLQLRE